MSYTGQEDIAIGREEAALQKGYSVQPKTLRFAHKFVGGESSLNLQSLSMPSEISTWSNPSPSEIAAANLLISSAGLSIRSSTGGSPIEGIDFVVSSNTGLSFINGYTPQPGEIWVGSFNLPVSNIVVGEMREFQRNVDALAGDTIINVGFTYKVNHNPTQQLGELKVMFNGEQRLLRNTGNAAASPLADGNYEEWDPDGDGYSTAIRLNNPLASNGFFIFEAGVGAPSADQRIISQLDRLGSIVTALATDASQGFYGDNDLTRYLTASASEIDRRTFGDLLLAINQRLQAIEQVQSTAPINVASAVKIPPATDRWLALTGNSIILPRGRWLLQGLAEFSNNGSSPGYSNGAVSFFGANGGDVITPPSASLSDVSGLTVLSSYNVNGYADFLETSSSLYGQLLTSAVIVDVTATSSGPIFLSAYAAMTTPANARVNVRMGAVRIGV